MKSSNLPLRRAFGVQYRSMHSAIHHVTVCSDKRSATRLLSHLREHSAYPDNLHVQLTDDPLRFDTVADIEIDYRRPPQRYREIPLVIVNGEGGIPDVY